MPDPAPSAELLRSLRHLVRGLSALFWGLPVALIACVEAAKMDWLRPLGILPPLATTALLLFGLLQMGRFQRQERVWRTALDRAQFLALVMAGLSPFLYWWNKVPGNPFFSAVSTVLSVASLIFLGQLNLVLLRLGAMLPDETLRQETRQFTALNRGLLAGALLLAAAYWSAVGLDGPLPRLISLLLAYAQRASLWLLVCFVLLPLAMTMALIWKTKEVILESVFGREH